MKIIRMQEDIVYEKGNEKDFIDFLEQYTNILVHFWYVEDTILKVIGQGFTEEKGIRVYDFELGRHLAVQTTSITERSNKK